MSAIDAKNLNEETKITTQILYEINHSLGSSTMCPKNKRLILRCKKMQPKRYWSNLMKINIHFFILKQKLGGEKEVIFLAMHSNKHYLCIDELYVIIVIF